MRRAPSPRRGLPHPALHLLLACRSPLWPVRHLVPDRAGHARRQPAHVLALRDGACGMTAELKTNLDLIGQGIALVRALVMNLCEHADVRVRPALAALDRVEEELDYATRPREAAGNMIPSGARPYVPHEISPEERAMRDREMEALTGRPQQELFGNPIQGFATPDKKS